MLSHVKYQKRNKNNTACLVSFPLYEIKYATNLVSKKSYLKTEKILGNYAEVKKYPVGHFDIYMGKNFEKAVNDQIAFFKKHFSKQYK